MTGIRHFTAPAVVFDRQPRVLLVHHNKVGRWLYPGGHIEPNADPAQAAIREVFGETGVAAEVLSGPAELPALIADAARWARGRP